MTKIDWPASIGIPVAGGPLRGTMRPPGSKSITNRALICAALAEGTSTLTGALDSEDTRVMVDSLTRVGIKVEANFDSPDPAARTVTIAGSGGRLPRDTADLYIANSGTSVRFLTAMLAVGQGTYRLDGTPRMRERPIGDLIESLRGLGVDLRSEADTGCPPVVIRAAGLPGGTTRVRGNVSSQFLSALLMAAPYAQSPLTIEVEGELVSRPYVEITTTVMRAFGIETTEPVAGRFVVPQGRYAGRAYDIEPDASAASYWFAAAAITGGEIAVAGLDESSLQGDLRFVDALERMGCEVRRETGRTIVRGGSLRGIDIDMNAISDTVQTLTAVALFAAGPTRVRGVAHNRHKETDRIGNLAIELRKFGAVVDEHEDGLTIHPPKTLTPASIATYHDHRMAMSLALVGLRVPGVEIMDPRCVEKTYPEFFEDLERLVGGKIRGDSESV
ncbi:MAG: 3-phosphoshikimate 1-carboxyvinyltransferase [Pirellulales bacterium]